MAAVVMGVHDEARGVEPLGETVVARAVLGEAVRDLHHAERMLDLVPGEGGEDGLVGG